jgi:iron complex transport system permease protein
MFGLLMILLMVCLFLVSLKTGSFELSLNDIFHGLFRREEGNIFHQVVYSVRLPRAAGAVVVGGSLGLAGTLMQHLLRNPLASPFTTGISQGAMFGATFVIIVLGTQSFYGNGTIVTAGAFTGALLCAAVVLLLAGIFNMIPETIVLTGVALSSFFSAGTMLLQYFGTEIDIASTVSWAFGDLGKISLSDIGLLLVVFIPSILFAVSSGWNFNAYNWGDDVAKSLGVNIRRIKITGLALSAVLVGAATAFVGIIGFVGLIAPHMVKMFVKGDSRMTSVYSAMTGALLLLLADILARNLLAPAVIPVGIITSFAGAPLFIYLLITFRRKI